MIFPYSVSAVLPAFNEAAVIAGVVERTAAALLSHGVAAAEVIVVDDGSSDDTASRASAVKADRCVIRVLGHPANRGYGAALRTGFEAARHDAVWLMDSDAQFDPQDIGRLLPHYRPDTAVLGFRARRRDTLMRRANHAAFFALVRCSLGPTVRDVNCAFKLFPRPVGVDLTAEGAMISTELVLRLRRSRYRIVEVAIPHYPRTAGSATGASLGVVRTAFAELWRLRRDPAALGGLAPPPSLSHK